MFNNNKFFNGIFKYILLMILLVGGNVTLDIILNLQSGSSLKELLDSRMLDVTNTAANMIDGDVLKDITPDDQGTPEYESIMNVLRSFQNNIKLENIYCIKDTGNDNFVFGLDPAKEKAGKFGSPTTYTDALKTASTGTPAVDPEAYEDEWGSFYSAYSPVFCSDGTIAGIVAVDFSSKWFDEQMTMQSHTAIILNSIALIVGGIMIIFMARGEKKRRTISEQLGATADIYVLMYEANLLNDSFTEIYNNKEATKMNIGSSRTNAREIIQKVSGKYIAESSKERMLEFVDLSTLSERLRDVNTVTHEFQSIEGKWCRARFIVSERASSGTVVRVMYLVENIDSEKKERDTALEAAKLMNNQISTVANIYYSMHDVDIVNNTISEIKTNVTHISNFFAPPVGNAQQLMFDKVDKSVHKLSKKAMLDFVDLGNIDERFKESDSLTEEFLNRNNVWCRARLIISKYNDEGKIEHILWLIESIDEEKRRRDAISEKVLNLNYQISSISKIYMVLYDVDLIDNSFSVIKSENLTVNNLVGDKRVDTQSVVNMVMLAITDESSIDETLKFIDLSTLETRLSNTNTVTLEILTITKKWIRIRFLVSRRTKSGKLSHVLWLAEDIDKEKKERDKLIDMSERAIAASEAKSSFLSNMSHEIRTPINAVLGMNEMILRECEDKNILAYSNSIMTAGTTLLGIINDILDFSKIESGKMEIIPVDYDLASVLNDLVSMIQTRADNKGLTLELEFDKNIPQYLNGDEIRIKQVITNLLTNAVKYTHKGMVTFGITYEDIENEPDFITLKVYIKDTGIGIKKEDMNKLFSEFERIEEERNRNIEGSGLGMNITKSLLTMMNSSLNVQSVYGLGSIFSFSLKQKVVSRDPIGDYETSYRTSLNSRKHYKEKFTAPMAHVLIIDDTPMNLMVFKSLLKQTKVQIDVANSGDEGISAVLEKKYDIIFLDHMMPKKDGIQTLKEMKAEPNNPNLDTITICLTANAISGAREQYITAGFDDYLTKPIDPARIEEMLMHYLPDSKVIYTSEDETEDNDNPPENKSKLPYWLIDISEIDTEKGLTNCGDESTYKDTLKTYAEMVNGYIDDIQKFYDAKDIKNATIKIHALKSTSRIIGAYELGELAQKLENAGKNGDEKYLAENIGIFLERCRKLSSQLSPLTGSLPKEDNLALPQMSDKEFTELCTLLKEFADSCDNMGISSLIDNTKNYKLDPKQQDIIQRVGKAADVFEYEKISEILK